MKLDIYDGLVILMILSIIGVYLYVYARPWMKGTMVKSDEANCAAPGNCPDKSFCCKDPNQGNGWCMTKQCSKIRLKSPSDTQVKFFKIYSITVLCGLLISLVFRWQNEKRSRE